MKDRDADLHAEIRSHLEMAIADRIARGATPAEAAAAARRQLGNLAQIQEADRDVWGRRWLERAAQDVAYACRILRRQPGFAAVAILSLALGIGANTALFQVVDAVRLARLPVDDPASLVQVQLTDMDGARGNFQTWFPSLTHPIWEAVRDRQQAFSGIFAWGADTFNLADGGEMRPARGLWVSGDFFRVLGIAPAAGRLLTTGDDAPGCPARAVLGHAFWQRAFGGSPAAIGQTLRLSTRTVEIVGVAPAGFHGLEVGRTFDFILPICADPLFSDDGKGRLQAGAVWWLSVFGRLKPGWTIERAAAQLASISPELFRATLPPAYPPVSIDKYLHFTLGAYPGQGGISKLREDYSTPLYLLLAVAALVLAIACANLANLLLARAAARQREFAVRLGLGASRARVVRQLLTEGLVLAIAGTAGALLLAGTLSRALIALLDPAGTQVTLPLGLDWRVLGFAALTGIATSLLFSLAPALRGTRIGAVSLLRASERGATAGREAVGLRRMLVIAQIALSVVLLFGAVLFVRSLRNVAAVHPGFNPDGVVVAGLNFRRLDVPPERRAAFRRELLERFRGLPGVQAAASATVVPISGDASGNTVWVDGQRSQQFNTLMNTVSSGYFAALGIPLVAGRDFDARDAQGSAPVAIVNEAFAARQPAGHSVLGARVTREATPREPEKTFEIVGVVKNSVYMDLKEDLSPVLYLADDQSGPSAYAHVLVRSALPPEKLTAAATALLRSIDPRIAVTYSVMKQDIAGTLVRERLLAMLSAGFGVLAAVLTIVGLYGLVSYSVTRRTNEIGVRIALGARAADITRLVARETGVLLAIGLAAGVLLALVAARSASTLLFGITPSDPLTLLTAVTALAAIALVATYAPTRRATAIEPVAALRNE